MTSEDELEHGHDLESLARQVALWRPDYHSDEILTHVVERAAATRTDPKVIAQSYLVRAKNGIAMPWERA